MTTINTPQIVWGRCRSQGRWFWVAQIIGGDGQHGWAANRNDAARKANRAAVQLAGGQYAAIRIDDTIAEQKVAAATQAKRTKAKAENKQRTTTGDTSELKLFAIAFGYYDHGARRWVHSKIVQLPVVKVTAKRIYFLRSSEPDEFETGYLDRQTFETRGWVYSSRHNKIYATPPKVPDDKPFIPRPPRPEYPRTTVTVAELKQLKAEMRAAHPDLGGSDAEFIRARERYVRARDLAKTK